MKNQNSVNPADCEFRISFARKGEHDREHEYFIDEGTAVQRLKELRAENYDVHLDHMDIVCGVPEYEIDWL